MSTTTAARTRKPKTITAKDLVGHTGPERIRIVGTRATWTTAEAAKDGRVRLTEPSKNGRQLVRWVDPTTQMEKVTAK